MPSRLSSLLVRDGLVGVKRMEKAFQRQVIYGGSLDTILLEMNVLSEERLTQYLALSSGLPPATRDEINVFDPVAVGMVPRDLAATHRVVPLVVQSDALRVLVCDPVDMILLEDLADVIDYALQPLIVPEYRWHILFHRTYGDSPPARFSTLARQADAGPQISPVGRARSVIVEEGDHVVVDVRPSTGTDPGLGPATPQAPATPVQPAATPAPAEHGDGEDAAAAAATPGKPPRSTLPGLAPGPAAVAALDSTMDSGIVEVPTLPPLGRPPIPGLTLSRPMPSPTPVRPSRGTLPGVTPALMPPSRGSRAPSSPPVAVPDPSPLTPADARAVLAIAEDRDTIFVTLLRALRHRTRWAGLLTVQGGAAIGRLALAEPGVDTAAVTTVLIPLDVVTPFRNAVTHRRPFVGTVLSGDPGIDAMVLRMGGAIPPSAVVMPIVLRERVVALVVGHRLVDELVAADVAELLPLAQLAAEAVSRLIVRHKAAGYRTPDGSTPVPVEDVETMKIARTPQPGVRAAGWAAPDPSAPPPAAINDGPTQAMNTAPFQPIADLLATIESGDATLLDGAVEESLDRLDEVLPELADRFPGRLKVGRYQVSGRALRAAQYGGLMELVVRIGPPCAELLITKMASPNRDLRFYATVCIGELRPRNAVHALVQRLFDEDFGVRAVAIDALAGYPLRDLDGALGPARSALHGTDLERVTAAAGALADLGDVGAVPDLISTLEIDSRHADPARRSLVALTKQDFGTSARKWRRWWDENQRRHRIEWLIDALGAKDAALRQAAIEELRRLTGEYFGYHHDLGKKEREASIQRWRHWWVDHGKRRFAREAVPEMDERMRATAQVPMPRDRP